MDTRVKPAYDESEIEAGQRDAPQQIQWAVASAAALSFAQIAS
jgi:hypothetical protein